MINKTKRKICALFAKSILFAPLLSACFADYNISTIFFQRSLEELNLDIPWQNDNLSYPIPDGYEYDEQKKQIENLAISMVHVQNENNIHKIESGTGSILNVVNDTSNNESNKFLIATNLHVARSFFNNIDLSKVNEFSTTSNDNLITNSSNSQNNYELKTGNFYFGIYNKNYKNTSDTTLTNLKSNDIILEPKEKVDTISNNSNANVETPDNTYIRLLNFNNKNDTQRTGLEQNSITKNNRAVRLIYAATNLSLNKNIFKFDNNINDFENYSHLIRVQKHDEIDWTETYNPSLRLGEKYNINNSIPNEDYDPDYTFKFAADFAVLEIEIPKTLQSKHLQSIVAKFTGQSSNSNSNVENISINPIGTTRAYTLNEAKLTSNLFIGGFKYNFAGNNQKANEILAESNKEGIGLSKWTNIKVNNGAFDETSLYIRANKLWTNKIKNKNNNDFEKNIAAQNGGFYYHDTNFLSIDQIVQIPELNLQSGSSGSLAVSKNWRIINRKPVNLNPISSGNPLQMVGMYKGVVQWVNPINNLKRYVGEVLMFSSIFRYDLVSPKNNLSKPSLCDVLIGKKIKLGNSTETSPTCTTSN